MPAPAVLIAERYEVGPVIGTGGMSTVHRGVDRRLGREVALKLFRTSAGPDTADRLRREAALLARLTHPHLVTAFDAGVAPEPYGAWLAMELVRGPDVATLIRRQRRLDSGTVRRIVRDCAEALAHIHARGVVHRDLKPGNVLLSADPADKPRWRAMVADFGIARIVDGAGITATGTIMGTAAYCSPEQTKGGAVGTASDVYSLGLVALEALTGERAFPGTAVESATARVFRDPGIPAWIDGPWRVLLQAMTAQEPGDRPSAAQVEAVCAAGLPAIDPDGAAGTGPTTALPAAALTAATTAFGSAVGSVAPVAAATAAGNPPHGATDATERLTASALSFGAPRTARLPVVAGAARGADGDRRQRPTRARWLVAASSAALVAGAVTVGGTSLLGAAPATKAKQAPVASVVVLETTTPTPTPTPTRTKTSTPEPEPEPVETAEPEPVQTAEPEPKKKEDRRSTRERLQERAEQLWERWQRQQQRRAEEQQDEQWQQWEDSGREWSDDGDWDED